jgi:hypothetical protein
MLRGRLAPQEARCATGGALLPPPFDDRRNLQRKVTVSLSGIVMQTKIHHYDV